MINSDALLTMRIRDLILRSIAKRCVSKDGVSAGSTPRAMATVTAKKAPHP
jgi:hypothetical protein